MRVDAILEKKAFLSKQVQPLDADDISARIVSESQIRRHRSALRAMKDRLGRGYLRVVRRPPPVDLGFSTDVVVVGERFAQATSETTLARIIRHREPLRRVLVAGCYLGGEEVQMWLRQGIDELDGIDVYNIRARWNRLVPELQETFGVKVSFQQASVEQLPFDDETFDLVTSNAVLEHVRNLEAMVEETRRVLRPGGVAWHVFGPLYFTFGGDHCITAYGDDAGYDHLLLDDREYGRRIADQRVFDRQEDPNLPFWARHDQFSFATADEYLGLFATRFRIAHVVTILSADGLRFRDRCPHKWQALLDAGIREPDLLVKSLGVVLTPY